MLGTDYHVVQIFVTYMYPASYVSSSKMSVEVTKIQNLPKSQIFPKKPKISKNGLLSLCDPHGLLGLLGLTNRVKKQGQKQVIGGTKIGPR
jgi:hypothetical protein